MNGLRRFCATNLNNAFTDFVLVLVMIFFCWLCSAIESLQFGMHSDWHRIKFAAKKTAINHLDVLLDLFDSQYCSFYVSVRVSFRFISFIHFAECFCVSIFPILFLKRRTEKIGYLHIVPFIEKTKHNGSESKTKEK